MKQIVNTADGSYDVLEVREVPAPEPGEEEIRIDVRAAGLNFADILARKGQYPDAPPKPCVMGYEVAGVVESAGSYADQSWVGKEVLGICRFKGQSEQLVIPAAQVYEKPASLSYAEAAALPVNYLTAWVLIVVMGSLTKDESILIHNAGGGVGLAALDIATHIGATTYGTSSKHKHEFLNSRGLNFAIDYRNYDWLEELMASTDGKGVELIIDPLGGREWKRSYQALRATGRLGMFGISSASEGSGGGLRAKWNMIKTLVQMPFFHPLPMLDKNRGVFGVNLGHLWREGEKARIWMDALLKGVEEGWIRPHVDRTFSYEEAGEAHRYIEERKNIGKVILVP
ncbi:MAG: zinc-binding dehydrogenase [Balneolaceae bacterium]|nr:zinc-binding dehydrogenase [Balneolaceae bacterium]